MRRTKSLKPWVERKIISQSASGSIGADKPGAAVSCRLPSSNLKVFCGLAGAVGAVGAAGFTRVQGNCHVSQRKGAVDCSASAENSG